MKSFKQYLTEYAETWSVKELVFGDISRTYVHIPLSLPMWKRITEINDMYGVHTTSIEGMERLIKLQGSSAQVSTADFATEVGIESMAGGIATDGGAVYGDAESILGGERALRNAAPRRLGGGTPYGGRDKAEGGAVHGAAEGARRW